MDTHDRLNALRAICDEIEASIARMRAIETTPEVSAKIDELEAHLARLRPKPMQ